MSIVKPERFDSGQNGHKNGLLLITTAKVFLPGFARVIWEPRVTRIMYKKNSDLQFHLQFNRCHWSKIAQNSALSSGSVYYHMKTIQRGSDLGDF